MRLTQKKGDAAVACAIAAFTQMGYDVSIPLTESAAYDLVVDSEDGLKKVQVKYCGGSQLGLRRVHSNSKGYVVKKTVKGAYDWLYIYSQTGSEYLVKNCLDGRNSVNLSTLTAFSL